MRPPADREAPHRRVGLPGRAAGLLLLALPLLPLPAVPGGEWSPRTWVGPGEWLLGIFTFAALAWLGALALPRSGLELERPLRAAFVDTPAGRFRAVAAAGLAALLCAAALGAFAGRPLLVDSIVQLFQARIFASGRIAAPPPPAGGFFATQHMLVGPGGWFAQYPPGHPALLAPGAAVGLAWAPPVLLSLGSAFLGARFARRVWGETAARIVLCLFLASPFFWFLGGSHMNHVSALFFAVGFLAAFAAWEEGGGLRAAGLAGSCLGATALVRPLEAVAVGIVFGGIGVGVWWRATAGGDAAGRGRRAAGVTVALVAAVAVAALYPLFNRLTTGDPWLSGYVALWGRSHGLGFHDTPWGGTHTLVSGVRASLLDLSLLNAYLFEWPLPALWPVGLHFAAGGRTGRWERRLLAAFLAIPLAYVFYWHRDAFLGPRYLYAGLAFLLPLAGRSLQRLWKAGRGRRLFGGSPLGAPDRGGLLLLLLALCTVYAAAWGAPARFLSYRSGLASLKVDLSERAREAGIEEGLVFVAVSWGNRLLARMRALGLSASLAERAYRSTDHCELEETLRRAEANAWRPGPTAAAVRAIFRPRETLAVARLNEDPTLRLLPGRPLTPACREELRYDQAGYANYTPFLAQNRPDLGGAFVFARDLREANATLQRRYPDRRAWLWRPDGFLPLPRPR